MWILCIGVGNKVVGATPHKMQKGGGALPPHYTRLLGL